MDSQQPSYDRLAKHYDFLSRLVFFKSQVRAQTDQLHYLKNCKNLLIVGGGTGWIIKDLNAVSVPIQITFVETSIKMIDLAKEVNTHHKLQFIHEDIENFKPDGKFDAILTPFLFDNFDDGKAEKVFTHLDGMLLKNAVWLYTDFRLDGKWWKKLLLKSMHLFFRLIKVVNIDSLPKTEQHFTKEGYQLLKQKFYYGGFIEGKTYQK